jgi:eukaryotic-like serine/threonine-protein kinase
MSKETKNCPICGKEILAVALKCKHCKSMLPAVEKVPESVDLSDQWETIHELLPGMSIGAGGRYVIERKLGQGGMGMVYLARDRQLDLEVALKMLPPQIASNPRAVRMLKDEAQVSVKLTHQNIVRFYNFIDDGHYQFLVMEYIAGKTLDDELAKSDRLSEARVKELLSGICDGLSYAHELNVLHRDLKPSNIMLTEEGQVKVCDFGIARQIKESMTRLTGQGISGTLPYMSPEQLRGKRTDQRSDVYSLGIVLYELLTGDVPFSSGEVAYQILHERPKPMEGVSAEMQAVVMQCLEKEPQARFGSMGEVLSAVEGKLNERRVILPPKELVFSTPEQTPRGGIWPAEVTGKDESGLRRLFQSIGFFRFLKRNPSLLVVLGVLLLAGWISFRVYRMREEMAITLPGGVKMEFVKIPAGSFKMGSEDGSNDEEPVHLVTISRDFWMGKYEVTQAQWQAMMGTTVQQQRDKEHRKLPLRGEGNNHPIYYVNWNDCQEFIRKVNSQVPGANFRLPSEAEWEYTARAGSTTRFHFGDNDNHLGSYAWCMDNSNRQIHPVGQKRPNAWGLYDMHGNVYEWCKDWYHDSYRGASRDGSARTSPEGKYRVLRGGCMYNDSGDCRSAHRLGDYPSRRSSEIGLRLARTL